MTHPKSTSSLTSSKPLPSIVSTSMKLQHVLSRLHCATHSINYQRREYIAIDKIFGLKINISAMLSKLYLRFLTDQKYGRLLADRYFYNLTLSPQMYTPSNNNVQRIRHTQLALSVLNHRMFQRSSNNNQLQTLLTIYKTLKPDKTVSHTQHIL